MNTPIVDFAARYAEQNTLRLHMPGHKGKGNFAERFDLTEIEGADVLYHAQGIIHQSEENAAFLFGAAKTVYSTEGSSLAIRAMLYLAKLCGKGNRIFAARNAHKTFITAAAVLDLDVHWLFSEAQETFHTCRITAQGLENALKKAAQPPLAVYVTSPDYLGNIAEISSLAEVCHRYGTLLLVDNAHGAYLRFLDRHPISLGADLCCDSAHKTLPVLTGGAYLHISKTAPKLFCEQAEIAMSIFASTSPSYLILQSLDAANRYLSEGYCEALAAFCQNVAELKQRLLRRGYALFGAEPLKLTLAPKSYGYTGAELAEILQEKGIVCEFSDPDFLVMMLTPQITAAELVRLENALLSVEKRAPIEQIAPCAPKAEPCIGLKNALFSASCELPIEQCGGKILASPTVTCPPAIPIVVCGERITDAAIACMKYYGIQTCRVIE